MSISDTLDKPYDFDDLFEDIEQGDLNSDDFLSFNDELNDSSTDKVIYEYLDYKNNRTSKGIEVEKRIDDLIERVDKLIELDVDSEYADEMEDN